MGRKRGNGFEHNSDGQNIHHILAKSHGGTNHENNKVLMDIVKHRALHILYGTEKPIQQLEQSFDLNSKVLIRDCSEDIKAVLDFWNKQGREAYNPEIIKKNIY